MTIIAFDGTTMAGDRASWCGSTAHPTRKVYRLDEHELPFTSKSVLVGFAGTSWFCFAVLEWMRKGGPYPQCPPDDKGKSCALIVDSRRRIWRLAADSPIAEPVLDRKTAFGATVGQAMAYGYMAAGGSAAGAVALCVKHTDIAGIGVDVISFKGAG